MIILIAAAFLAPAFGRSLKRSQKGRLGSVATSFIEGMATFIEGMATAHDPYKAMIVQEMEKRQNEDGEEVGGEEERLKG